jgi:hypothetical protein
MLSKIRGHLTYANVVSTLCLFVLLGGGAWAATKLAKNSVGAKQIKKNAVKAAEIKANSVKTAELADGSVSTLKLADGAVVSSKVGDGSLRAEDLALPEPWHEVGPGSDTEDLCSDPANTAVFCSKPPLAIFAPWSPWENWGSGYATAAFYKDQLGIVHLRGLVAEANQASSSPIVRSIFRLPAGYRPDSRRLFTTNGRDAVGGLEVAVGRIDIHADGLVEFMNDCNGGLSDCSATGPFVTLDGISFRPDE